MSELRHILVPLDYSEHTYRAYVEATHLARRHQAVVHVLRVVVRQTLSLGEVLQNLSFAEVDVAEQLRLSTIRYAHSHNGSRKEMPGQVVHAEQHAASVSAGILAYAEAQDIDLIVLGLPPCNDDLHLIRQDKMVEKVIRQAPCPVLTVNARMQRQLGDDIRRILVPVDFSQASPLTITYAKTLAATYEADLFLLHVVEEPTNRPYSAVHSQVPEARKALDALATTVDGPDVAAQSHVRTGPPAQVIIDFANTHAIDLILMAPHSRSDRQQVLLDSVTASVLREAPCMFGTVKTSDKTLDADWIMQHHEQVAA